jgi:hypothetical protein
VSLQRQEDVKTLSAAHRLFRISCVSPVSLAPPGSSLDVCIKERVGAWREVPDTLKKGAQCKSLFQSRAMISTTIPIIIPMARAVLAFSVTIFQQH